MTANLAGSTNWGDASAAASGANGNGRTWREVEHWVEELTALARTDVSPETYYAALLSKLLAALTASGGAVCQRGRDGSTTALAQINFPSELLSSANRSARWPAALASDAATRAVLPPGDDPLLVSAVREPDGTATFIEVVLARDLPTEALENSLRLMDVFREVAAEFQRERELAALRRRGEDLAQFDEFVLRIHDSLDLVATAYSVANDGRLWIGCDRLSVVRLDQGLARALAVSGVDQIDRRSAAVSSLERLTAAVAPSAEPLIWPQGSATELAPQIEQALQSYLDISHGRQLIVMPLGRRCDPKAGDGEAIRGALIAESFDERLDVSRFRERTQDVARHGGAALLAALDHHDLPLLPLQVKIARLLRMLRRRRVAVAMAVALIVAIVGLLAVVPADFSVEARGTLQPKVRRHLFAPADGVVESVLVEHGTKVAQGEPLLVVRDPRLDLDYSRIGGELQTAQARLSAVQAQRSSRNTAPDSRADDQQLAAEEEQLKEQVRGLQAQQELLVQLRGELRVTSPLDGVLLTWNTADVLQDRPVKQGQLLVTVADPAGPWVLELRVPDSDVGYLLAAQRQGVSELPVSYLLATDPVVTHRGQIERVALATDLAEDNSPGALTIVKLDGQPATNARAGTSVTARIHCGRRPIGYVWLHDLIEAVRTQVLF